MPRLAFIAGLATALGCSSPPPARPASTLIWPLFDPTTNQLPTPTDLARDADAGRLALPITADLNPAEAAFRQYLNTLDGYPTASPAIIPFSGSLAAASLDGGEVVVLQMATGGGAPTAVACSPSWDATQNAINLYPDGGWTRGAQYVVAVRGGASGVAGASGQAVDAAPIFYFLRSGQDLTQHPWAFPGGTPQVRAAEAAQLEVVREQLEPFIEAVMSAEGWARTDIAVLFTFTTSSHPELHFDPLSQDVPMPNDLVLDPTTHLVSLPPSPTDTPLEAQTKLGLNTLDGFSTTGPFSADTTAPIDPSTVTPSNLRLFELTDPPTEVKGITTTLYGADDQHMFAQINSNSGASTLPVVLAPKTTYAWVISGQVGADGAPVDAQPVGALIRIPAPLVDSSGHSQVSGVSDANAALIEPLRSEVQPLLQQLEAQGLSRLDVEAVVPFTTLDVHAHIAQLWDTPYEQALSSAPVDFTRKGTTDVSLAAAAALPNVAAILEGHFETFDRLDPITQAFATGQPNPVAFTLTYPTGIPQGQKAKVVLFGHALETERRLSWFEANRLAQAGFAVFSFDWPYHGERSSCNVHLPVCEVLYGLFTPAGGSPPSGLPGCDDSSAQAQAALLCSSGQCGADGQCVGGTLNTYSLFDLGASLNFTNPNHELGTPFASGGAIINIEDLFATRDHLRQAMIDASAAYRFLTTAPWATLAPDLPLDLSDVKYAGVSLGGIFGGTESGFEPHISTLALNVGGAGLVDLFQESLTFAAVLPPGLAAEGIVVSPENPAGNNLAGWQFLTAAHWALDDVDPINIAAYALEQPQTWIDPATGATQPWPQKHVLVQMAGLDTVVSNNSTYRLRDVIDPTCAVCSDPEDTACLQSQACVFTEFPLGTHVFEVDPLETLTGSAQQGQDQVANFLSSY